MTLQYQIMADKVIDIATQYGSLEILQNRIQSIAIEKTKAAAENKAKERAEENKKKTEEAVNAQKKKVNDAINKGLKDLKTQIELPR